MVYFNWGVLLAITYSIKVRHYEARKYEQRRAEAAQDVSVGGRLLSKRGRLKTGLISWSCHIVTQFFPRKRFISACVSPMLIYIIRTDLNSCDVFCSNESSFSVRTGQRVNAAFNGLFRRERVLSLHSTMQYL